MGHNVGLAAGLPYSSWLWLHISILFHIFVEADAGVCAILLEQNEELLLHFGVDEYGSSFGTAVSGFTAVWSAVPEVRGVARRDGGEHTLESLRPKLFLDDKMERTGFLVVIFFWWRQELGTDNLQGVLCGLILMVVGIAHAGVAMEAGCHGASYLFWNVCGFHLHHMLVCFFISVI